MKLDGRPSGGALSVFRGVPDQRSREPPSRPGRFLCFEKHYIPNHEVFSRRRQRSSTPVTGYDGWAGVTNQEIEILDLSKVARGEWVPPIGAMGGPPAHELYRDLVSHAGLRLYKGEDGSPWVEIQDGERRRRFPVPSAELRAALDRFRMRRNLRPVPESDIDEFARVIAARISDPDVEIPTSPPQVELAVASVGRIPSRTPVAPTSWAVDELDDLMHEVDAIQGRVPPPREAERPEPAAPRPPNPLHRRMPQPWQTAVSSARAPRSAPDPRLPKYVRALRELVQDGTWIGNLSEIARRTGDDTSEVFCALLQFHTDLVGNGLVVAPVEVEEGWQWVVVDRTRMRSPDGGLG